MSDKVVKDSNEVELKRGDRIYVTDDEWLDGYDRNGVIVKIESENNAIVSMDDDPTALMNLTPYTLIKKCGPGTRNDYKDELARLAERVEKLETQLKLANQLIEAYKVVDNE